LSAGEEGVKDFIADFRGDSGAIVAYDDLHCFARRSMWRCVGITDAKFDGKVSSLPQGFQRVNTQRAQGDTKLHRIGLDHEWIAAAGRMNATFLRRSLAGNRSQNVIHKTDNVNRLQYEFWRPREKHHVGQHFMSAKGLAVDGS